MAQGLKECASEMTPMVHLSPVQNRSDGEQEPLVLRAGVTDEPSGSMSHEGRMFHTKMIGAKSYGTLQRIGVEIKAALDNGTLSEAETAALRSVFVGQRSCLIGKLGWRAGDFCAQMQATRSLDRLEQLGREIKQLIADGKVGRDIDAKALRSVFVGRHAILSLEATRMSI